MASHSRPVAMHSLYRSNSNLFGGGVARDARDRETAGVARVAQRCATLVWSQRVCVRSTQVGMTMSVSS
eukprot:92105-Chlamydomonas_euryale.AAC.2